MRSSPLALATAIHLLLLGSSLLLLGTPVRAQIQDPIRKAADMLREQRKFQQEYLKKVDRTRREVMDAVASQDPARAFYKKESEFRKKRAREERRRARDRRARGRSGSRSQKPGAYPPAPRRKPWAERVTEARAILGEANLEKARAALDSREEAEVFLALERFYKLGERPPEAKLVRLLSRVREGKLAMGLAYHLGRAGSEPALAALADHVAREGVQAQAIQEKFLGKDGEALVAAAKQRRAERQRWMNTVAGGKPGSSEHQEALASLAKLPGSDINALLLQLSGDRDPKLSTPAKEALASRRETGLAPPR